MKENTTKHPPIVYAVAAIGTPRVKLGTTTDITQRLHVFHTSCPYPVQLLRTWEGDETVETALHRELNQYRKHGEWFEVSLKILDDTMASLGRVTPIKANWDTKTIQPWQKKSFKSLLPPLRKGWHWEPRLKRWGCNLILRWRSNGQKQSLTFPPISSEMVAEMIRTEDKLEKQITVAGFIDAYLQSVGAEHVLASRSGYWELLP